MTTPQKTGTPVVLPSLGENVTEATITRWLKAPGDRIEADEPLLEVATDKVDTELPSPVAGTILELVVGEGDSVTVDAVIAILGTGAVVERVVPHRDSSGSTAFGVRSMVYLAITYDHRIIDGADAARFLATIKQRLESVFTAAELR